MRNITAPRTVSFEDALRNLASRLTGVPAASLPRTQEGIVQYMAENVPTVDALAEVITQEVMARLEAAGEDGEPPTGAENATDGSDNAKDTGDTPEPKEGTEDGQKAAEKPKRTRKTKTTE